MTGFLLAALGIFVALGMTALGDMVSEEVRDRLDHLPHAILRLAARRLDPAQRAAAYDDEWMPELTYILKGDEARPITRLYHGISFALGILVSAGRSSRDLDRSKTQPDVQVITDVDVWNTLLPWRKSALADDGRDCVEVAFTDEAVLLRHSRAPSHPVLSFSTPEWRAFLNGARNGEFDFLR